MTAAAFVRPYAQSLHLPGGSGVLFVLAAVAMWASYLAYARAGIVSGLAPQDFVFLRYATAGLVMLPWLLRHRPGQLAGVGWGRGALLALLAGPLFIFLGRRRLRLRAACAWRGDPACRHHTRLDAIAWALLRERMTANRLAGVGVIVVGLLLIAGGQPANAMGSARMGGLLFVGAGLFWAIFTVLLKRWGGRRCRGHGRGLGPLGRGGRAGIRRVRNVRPASRPRCGYACHANPHAGRVLGRAGGGRLWQGG